MKEVTLERLNKYIKITEDDLKKMKKCKDGRVIDTIKRYYEDAKYYKEKGDLVTSFACINYAHGWLDCAKKLKIIK